MIECTKKEAVVRTLFDHDRIIARSNELAIQIKKECGDKPLSVIVLANGAIFFAAELLLRLRMDVELDVLAIASYNGMERAETIVDRSDVLKIDLNGRQVLVIDDVFDSGKTIEHVFKRLQKENPAKLKSCVLLLKNCKRDTSLLPDYHGFVIEDEFVVGYGLDYNERYRNLPYVGVLDT